MRLSSSWKFKASGSTKKLRICQPWVSLEHKGKGIQKAGSETCSFWRLEQWVAKLRFLSLTTSDTFGRLPYLLDLVGRNFFFEDGSLIYHSNV